MDINNSKIAVIGLGYVGLPLMVEFASIFLLWASISTETVWINSLAASIS